jgi:hypothetical protein
MLVWNKVCIILTGIVKVHMYVAVFLVSSPFWSLSLFDLSTVLYCVMILSHNSQIPKPMCYDCHSFNSILLNLL